MVARLQGLKIGVHYKFNGQSNIITFYNGSEILLKDLAYYPSDPDFSELGSLEITFAFVDECNQIIEKAWEILKSRIRYMLDVYDLIPKILGSCNPSKEWPFRRFFKLWEARNETVGRRFIQSLVTDNPEISKHYIANLKSLSDTITKERLLKGNWNYDSNPDMLCTYDGIKSLFGGNILYKTGKHYLTADVARFGGDEAVILVWDGFIVIDYITFEKSKTTEILNAINYFRIKYNIPKSRCIADDDGVGGGPVDFGGINGFVNNSKPFGSTRENEFDANGLYNINHSQERYYNLQAQCGYKFAEYVNEHLVGFDVELDISLQLKDNIQVDLEQLQSWELDKEWKGLKLKPKAEIKVSIGRSPDWRDALLMRMWFLYVEETNTDYYKYL